jgi:SAM-dependent methyltransferase
MKCINCNSGYKQYYKDFFVCETCELYWNSAYPTKENLKIALRNFLLSGCSNKETERLRLVQAQEQVDVLNKYCPEKGIVFDVAAAGGFFMKVAKENGWIIYGNEISVSAVEWAHRTYNIDIICEYFEDINLVENIYDAVVFWNTLEHMHNPLESIKKAHSILKVGGLIYIRVPNKNADELIKYYEALHSYEFSKINLDNLLTNNGFEKIFINGALEIDLLYKKV